MNQQFSISNNVIKGKSIKAIEGLLDRNKNLALWDRGFGNFLEGWASNIKWERFENIEMFIDQEKLELFESQLTSQIDYCAKKSPDLNSWFVSDVIDLTSSFFRITGAERILIKIYSDSSTLSELKIFDKHIKLICNYLDDGLFVCGRNKNQDDEGQAIQLGASDIAFLKGEQWPGNAIGGASYRITNTKERSLVLEIDYFN